MAFDQVRYCQLNFGLDFIYLPNKNVEKWVTEFDQSPNVTVKTVAGDHHYFVEEERAAETAELIDDFIK